ncbi:MAG: RNA-binding domain-containing protein [Candidatus Firestonebacteria bacterium]
MTIKENISKLEESEIIEFKESVSEWKEIIETVSAFSNTSGGKIFVGITNAGEIRGVKKGKDTIEDLVNKIITNTDPRAYPKISIKSIQDKQILVIEVKESTDKLVLAFGRPFKRIGKSTVRMSKDEYEKRILEKHKEKLYFDSEICKSVRINDLDKDTIKKFLELAKVERRLEFSLQISLKEALEKLNLIVNGKLTNAAILLFGKNSQKFILQSEIKAAEYLMTVLRYGDVVIFQNRLHLKI